MSLVGLKLLNSVLKVFHVPVTTYIWIWGLCHFVWAWLIDRFYMHLIMDKFSACLSGTFLTDIYEISLGAFIAGGRIHSQKWSCTGIACV